VSAGSLIHHFSRTTPFSQFLFGFSSFFISFLLIVIYIEMMMKEVMITYGM